MTPMDQTYPAGLDGMPAELDLRQRSSLAELDRQLYAHWDLGRNLVLAFTPAPDGVRLLVVGNDLVARYVGCTAGAERAPHNGSHDFIVELLSGSRHFGERQLANAARLLGAEPLLLRLQRPLGDSPEVLAAADHLLRRYSISFIRQRAVALFDIVGFSLLSPFEQMMQLNSLSCSLNAAQSRLLARRLCVNFARSGTGDGFYIWNRDTGLEANTNLYHFMHLVLADNAIARTKAAGQTVPLLRTGFHVGSCYEFHQAEGLNPTVHTDIVGDVTIELARMVERALPGQILVGDFAAAAAGGTHGALDFIDHAQQTLVQLNGLVLSGEAVEAIKCYLTGRAQADGNFTIRKLSIHDKHGRSRIAYNAKVNIHRRGSTPILLGLEDRQLRDDADFAVTSAHVVRGTPAAPAA
jgi:class 3 adenylate cyclase